MDESVILVDTQDNPIGLMPKMEAHQKGLLHRAFSVFVFNDKGELLLQQRASNKYHSSSLWTNTCCSHQRQAETSLQAATRRLQEEMGFTCPLTEKFQFIYRAELENGLTEHELDHVMMGTFNGAPKINSTEVADYKWKSLQKTEEDLKENPQNYTAWFKIIFDKYHQQLTAKCP